MAEIVMGATLVAAGAPGVFSQPYYAVSGRGSTLSGQLAVWQVEASGEISQHWIRDTVAGSTRIHPDPFGRFVIFSLEEQGVGERIELWRVEQDHTLTLADTFASPEWGYSPDFSALSQDGRWFVISMGDRSGGNLRLFTRAFRITDDLRIEPGGEPLPRPSSTDLIGITDYAVSCQGPVVVATNAIERQMYRFDMSPAGDITWDGNVVQFSVSQTPSGTDAMDVRWDGRIIATAAGGLPDPVGAMSFAVSASGEVEMIDELNAPAIPSLSSFTSNGMALIGGGGLFTRVNISRAGTFPGTFTTIPAGSTGINHSDVTFDGRLALFGNVNASGSSSGFRTYFTPTEGGLVFADELRVPGTWEDTRFIPPRTEDLLGDANADGLRNAADIVAYVRHFNDPPDIGGPTDPTITGPVPMARADANQDGEITAKDLEWLIDFLLVDTADP